MCNFYLIFGGCCGVAGPFDWYGQRRAAFGQNEIPGSDWPDEPNEAEWFYRTPTQWDNPNYSPALPTIGHLWYTSQDADTPWAIEYLVAGQNALTFLIGSINLSVAPYAFAEVCYTRRSNARTLTLDGNVADDDLDNWDEGADATFTDTRLECDVTGVTSSAQISFDILT